MKTLTQKEIAAKLGVSVATVRRTIQKNKIEPVGTDGNSPLFPASVVPTLEKRRKFEALQRLKAFRKFGRMAHAKGGVK